MKYRKSFSEIANSSTNGYRPEVANFEEGSPNGVTVNISQAGAAAASGAAASSSPSSDARNRLPVGEEIIGADDFCSKVGDDLE